MLGEITLPKSGLVLKPVCRRKYHYEFARHIFKLEIIRIKWPARKGGGISWAVSDNTGWYWHDLENIEQCISALDDRVLAMREALNVDNSY